MQRIADELDIAPTRISFVATLRECALTWQSAALGSPGNMPRRMATVTDRMRHFVLPPRRPERVFPRAVKIKMSNYARKVPTKSPKRAALTERHCP